MAHIIDLKTFTDDRGNLTVIEKVIPFDIKRIFYIYGVDDSTRGGHRHHKTMQAAICLQGHCTISNPLQQPCLNKLVSPLFQPPEAMNVFS